MSKIMVIGASGLVGSYLIDLLEAGKEYKIIKEHWNGTIFGKSISEFSIIGTKHETKNSKFISLNIYDNDESNNLIRAISPDIIILCASETNVDAYEENSLKLLEKNTKAVKSISEAAYNVRSKLIYLSSDYIFDGSFGPYAKDTIPNPINKYGLSKLISENIVLQQEDQYVIRLSSVFGFDKDSSTVRLLDSLCSNKEYFANLNTITPTHASIAALGILKIISNNTFKTSHIAGRKKIKKYEFLQKIIAEFNATSPKSRLDEKYLIKSSEELNAKRPQFGGLISDLELDIYNFGINLFIKEYKDHVRINETIVKGER